MNDIKIHRDAIKSIDEEIKALETRRRVHISTLAKILEEEQAKRTAACKEHHYLPGGKWTSYVECQFCGNQIG